jgi:hypothetical protein
MPSFSSRTQNHIILVCIALQSFICDSKLFDQDFDKCDDEDDYIPGAACVAPQTQGDGEPEMENEESMKDIWSRIVHALVMVREE